MKPLTQADRAWAIERALHSYENEYVGRCILAEPDLESAARRAAEILRNWGAWGRNDAGEHTRVEGLMGNGKGLVVEVGERGGLIRWTEIANAVRPPLQTCFDL